MNLRKSKDACAAGRLLHSSLSPDSVENRGWWKGIHDELISLMRKPHLVQRITKRIVHFASRSLKRSPESETDSNCTDFERSLRHSNRMARRRLEDFACSAPYQSEEDSHEENEVLQNSTPCRPGRKRRKTPLRTIQPIIVKAFETSDSCTVIDPKFDSGTKGLVAYGHTLKRCVVVLDCFPQEYLTNRSEAPVKTADDVDSKQANENNSNSSPENNDQNGASKKNEAATNGCTNDAADRASTPDSKPTDRFSSKQQDPKRRKMMSPDWMSSDDEGTSTFSKVFSKAQFCETRESDTEDFWAEHKKYRDEIDYQKEAEELLGLTADFSVPLRKRGSLETSSDISSESQRSSPRTSTPNRGQTSRRRSSAHSKKSPRESLDQTLKRVPKWQQAKEKTVKVSRSGRLVKPPIDDRYL